MPEPVGFFTDTTICIGCKACQVACHQWNDLPAWTDERPRDGRMSLPVLSGDSYDNTRSLSAVNWRHVKFIEQFSGDAGRSESAWLMMSDVCKHCAHAPCLEVCPTGAIIRTEFDTVYIQEPACNGCRDCVAACPFGVIHMSQSRGIAQKCTFCYSRLQANLTPACAKACPTQSIKFGELEDMHRLARERLGTLRSQGVTEAQLYDEKEHGGLHALFLLKEPPEAYGLPNAANAVLPRRNNRKGYLGSLATAAIGALAAVVAFRNRGARAMEG